MDLMHQLSMATFPRKPLGRRLPIDLIAALSIEVSTAFFAPDMNGDRKLQILVAPCELAFKRLDTYSRTTISSYRCLRVGEPSNGADLHEPVETESVTQWRKKHTRGALESSSMTDSTKKTSMTANKAEKSM